MTWRTRSRRTAGSTSTSRPNVPGNRRATTSFDQLRDVYDRHVGRYSTQLVRAFVERSGVRAGDRALDVGCGPGPVPEELARRLGAENVTAVDPSEVFVAACRARVPGAEVRVGGGEALPFGDSELDIVLSQLVVNFMVDPARGVREMARVARRTVASCVWDYAGEMWILRRYDDYWSPFPFGIAPSGAYAASLSPERRNALRAAVFRRLGEPAGPFTLTARAWFVRGELR